MSALLIGAHQAGVADDIGGEDRRQPALKAQMIGRPQASEQPSGLGRQPLHEDGPASRQHSGDPGVAYLRPNFLQHDPASFDRRAPPGTNWAEKRKAPSVSGGALETAC